MDRKKFTFFPSRKLRDSGLNLATPTLTSGHTVVQLVEALRYK
jgi:hypothetical protein